MDGGNTDLVAAEVRQAGDDAVRNEQPVEVGADALRQRLEALRGRAPAGPDADLAEPTERLEGELGGPGADEVPGEIRVRRLERVLPVPSPVDRQRGAGITVLLDPLDLAFDSARSSDFGVGGPLHRVDVGVRDFLVEERQVVRRLEVVAQRLERPVNHVTVAVGLLDLAIPIEHEPLRPVAGLRVLVRVDGAKMSRTGAELAGREEVLHGSLADVADTPRGAARTARARAARRSGSSRCGRTSEARRRVERCRRPFGPCRRAQRWQAGWAAHASTEERGRGPRLGQLLVEDAAGDREVEAPNRLRCNDQVLALDVDRADQRRIRRHEVDGGRGIALSEQRLRPRLHPPHVPAVHVDVDRSARAAFVLPEDEVVGDDELHRLSRSTSMVRREVGSTGSVATVMTSVRLDSVDAAAAASSNPSPDQRPHLRSPPPGRRRRRDAARLPW